jgi:hypothetical protein
MDTVFLLWHTGPPQLDDEGMLIGVFGTEQEAKDAINALANKPGFVDYPDCFFICPYELGKLHWTEGFAIPED